MGGGITVFSTAGVLSGLGFSAGSIQSSPVHPVQSTYSFSTVQGNSGQFQTVPTYLLPWVDLLEFFCMSSPAYISDVVLFGGKAW